MFKIKDTTYEMVTKDANSIDGSIVGEDVQTYREMMLLRGLRAEMRGMRLTRGPKCSTIVRQQYKFRGNHEKLMTQLIQDMTKRGVIRKRVTITQEDN